MTAPTRTGSRIVELTAPSVVRRRALLSVLGAAWAGLGITFAVQLVLALVLEELEAIEGVDLLFRGMLGGSLVVFGALAIVTPTLAVLHDLAVLRAVEELSASDPGAVPPAATRRVLKESPALAVRGWGTFLFWVGIGLAVLFAVAFVATGHADEAEPWVLVAAGMALAVVGWLLRRYGVVLVARYDERVTAIGARWEQAVPAAQAREKSERGRLTAAQLPRLLQKPPSKGMVALRRILTSILGTGAAVLFLSMILRQPCRGCARRTWDAPMEAGIDGLSLFGGVTLIIGVVAIAAVWAAFLAQRILVERALTRWLDDTGACRVETDRIRSFLTLPTAWGNVSATLVFLGTAALIVGLGMLWSGWHTFDPFGLLLTAAALLAVGALTGIAAGRRQVLLRERLRDTTWPGDVKDPAEIAHEKQIDQRMQEMQRKGREARAKREAKERKARERSGRA